MLPFEREEFESVCNFFHEAHSHGTLVAPTFHTPVYYHTDTWELSGNTLTRIHKREPLSFLPKGLKTAQLSFLTLRTLVLPTLSTQMVEKKL